MPNNNKSVTFVHGSDDYLVDRRARNLYEQQSNGRGAIFCLDCEQQDILQNVISALSTTPLFEDDNTVWLRAVEFFSEKNTSEREKESISQIIELLSNNREKNVIISASNVDKRKKIFKDISAISNVISLDDDGQYGPDDFIRTIAKESGATIDESVIEILHGKCGSNYRQLEQEINKLATYAADKEKKISSDDVMLLVDDCASENFFEPVEAFFSKNTQSFFRSVERYFFSNSDARPLISAIQSRNRILIQLRTLIDAKEVNCGNSFSLKKAFDSAAKWYHMDGQEKSPFNIFSQNTWYVGKLVDTCSRFSTKQFLELQLLLSKSVKELASSYSNQQSVMKKIAVEWIF